MTYKDLIKTLIHTEESKKFMKYCDENYADICGVDRINNYILQEKLFSNYMEFIDCGCNRAVFKWKDKNNVPYIIKIELCEMGGNYSEREFIELLKSREQNYLLENLNVPLYHYDRFQVYKWLDILSKDEYNKYHALEIVDEFLEFNYSVDDLDDRPNNFGINSKGLIVISDYEEWEQITPEEQLKLLNHF